MKIPIPKPRLTPHPKPGEFKPTFTRRDDRFPRKAEREAIVTESVIRLIEWQLDDMRSLDTRLAGLLATAAALLVSALLAVSALREAEIESLTTYLLAAAAVCFVANALVILWAILPQRISRGPLLEDLWKEAFDRADESLPWWRAEAYTESASRNRPVLAWKAWFVLWAALLLAVEVALVVAGLINALT